ncbi:hypothetical protein [Nonomuraea sp. NPDC046570]
MLQLRLELGEHAEVVAEVPLLIEQNRLEEPLYLLARRPRRRIRPRPMG